MALPYYIEGTTRLWLKDNIAPFGTNTYYVQKISGYSPNADNIFDFIDNFDDNSINTTKWFADGQGTIEEVGGQVHIKGTIVNKYPRYVTKLPLYLRNYIVEYDFKPVAAANECCRIGYTSFYVDGSELANWFIFIGSNRYIYFYTRIGGTWVARWTYSTALPLNVWYKMQIIDTVAGIKLRLLSAASVLIAESGSYLYDNHVNNSIYFGQRTVGDEGYFDNFTVRRYSGIEPTVTVHSEAGGYKVIVANNSNEELREYQFSVLASSLGTLTSTTSLCINPLSRTPLTQQYFNTNAGCVLNIPNIDRDITKKHTLATYNTTKTVDRFNGSVSSTAFNGSSTRASIPTSTDLDLFNTNYFTLIIWLKQIGNYTTTDGIILSKSSGTTANRWDLHIINNEIGFYIYDVDSSLTFAGGYSPIKINDGLWHMITFVRNGTNVLTYKDGAYVRTFALTNIANFSNAYNVNIGCKYTTAYDKYFNGNCGEIVYYNETAFTDAQVKKYYNTTKYKYITPISHGVQF